MAHAVVIEAKCDPSLCPRGVCAAKKACPWKCILQYEPGEVPVSACDKCNGCNVCAKACPAGAVVVG